MPNRGECSNFAARRNQYYNQLMNRMKRLTMMGMAVLWGCMAAQAQRDSIYKEMKEIVVTGAREATDVRHLPMTVTVVDREALTAQHQTSVLPSLMLQVPSLFVTQRQVMGYGVSTGAAGGISLRGITGGAGQLLVLVDGHPQYNGVYGHPIADSYQTMLAERVEVLRGPASVLYGSNAMGGVVNIVTRKQEKDGVSTHMDVGAGSYGTVQAEASNQVRKGRFSSTVAAQYQRSDNHRPHMGFEQYGGFVKLGYLMGAHWKATADVNLTHFNATYPGQTSAPVYGADQWITRGMVAAALENRYGRSSGALSVYSDFGRHKIDDGWADPLQPTTRYFRSKDALTGLSFYQGFQLFRTARLTAGVDYQHIYGNAYYTSKADGSILDTPNKQSGRSERDEIAGYVDYRHDLARWVTVDAGIRVDHHSISGTEWIPQVGIVMRPTTLGELKLMASKGFRNPTMRELYLYPPSNTELEPERIWNYELAWHHQAGRFTYGANVFYLNGDNMIQTINRQNVNTGKVENCGLELEAAWHINDHWQVNTNHSFLHMEHPVVAAPEYKGMVGGTFHQGRWSMTANLQYLGGLYTATGENEKKEDVCLLGATVSYQACRWMGLWLRGENLLAQRYEINEGYPMPKATVMAGVHVNF